MATASSIVRRALRLISAIDPAEAVPAQDMQDGIASLNNLGQRWLANGLIAAWTDVSLPTDSVVTPAAANDALSYALALKVAPEYGIQVSDVVIAQAEEEKRLLWRDRLATADTTVNGVILRALRIISSPGVTPDSVSFSSALVTLNAMLAEWHEAAIGLPDYSVTGLADTLASDAGDREAIAYQLAIRLAPEYGAELSPLAMQAANDSMNRLRLRYFQPGCVDFSELPSPHIGFNIETGE